jgi:hypothetical protein
MNTAVGNASTVPAAAFAPSAVAPAAACSPAAGVKRRSTCQ